MRQAYTIHSQMMAMCHVPGSGQFVVVFTEPPPHITRSNADAVVRALFQSAITGIERRRHELGFDGWAEDLVISGRAESPQKLDILMNDLGLLAYFAFGTTYKAEIEDIARLPPAPFFASPAPVEVRSSELESWLFGTSAQRFTRPDGGRSARLAEWADLGSTGVFASEAPGLMVLIVPRSAPLNQYATELRRFAVDTDAFLGAASLEKNHVALIGRERSVGFAEMPPLRVETILLLASIKAPQISQSYERTRVFAGKLLSDARALQGWDWAPILLSDELIDTEYGSLLNFTDNMLKSWSENGEVEYKGFPHDRPPRFPFLPDGALRRFGGNQLTYNWNTAGVGFLAENNRRLIFSVLKTGSLPVSYFPEGSSTTAAAKAKLVSGEDQAYEYFNGLRSPMLSRALQYAAVYQTFQAFQIKATSPHDPAPATATMSMVEGLLKTQVLETIAALTRPDVPITNEWASERQFFGQSQIDRNQLSVIRLRVAAIIGDLDASEGPGWRESFAAFVARGGGSTLEKSDKDDKLAQKFKLVYGALSLVRVPETVRAAVVARAGHDSASWIRTPTIVVSRGAQQGRTGVGGHNIGGRATRVEADASVTRGEVWISGTHDEGHVIRLHPEDAARSRDLVRLFDREAGFHADNIAAATDALEARLRAPLPNPLPVRPISTALNRPAAGSNGDWVRGASTSPHARPVGYTVERVPPEAKPVSASRTEPTVWVRKENNVFEIRRTEPPPPIARRAPNEASLKEVLDDLSVMPPPISQFHFSGIDPLAVRNLTKSMNERMARANAAAGRGGGKPPGGRPPIETMAAEGPERGRSFSAFISDDRGLPGGSSGGSSSTSSLWGLVDRIPSFGRKQLTVKASGHNAVEVMQSRPNWAKAEISFPDASGLIHLEAPHAGMEVHVALVIVPRDAIVQSKLYEMRFFSWFREALSREKRVLINAEITSTLRSAATTRMEDLLISIKALMSKHSSEKTLMKIIDEGSDVSVVELQLGVQRRDG